MSGHRAAAALANRMYEAEFGPGSPPPGPPPPGIISPVQAQGRKKIFTDGAIAVAETAKAHGTTVEDLVAAVDAACVARRT